MAELRIGILLESIRSQSTCVGLVFVMIMNFVSISYDFVVVGFFRIWHDTADAYVMTMRAGERQKSSSLPAVDSRCVCVCGFITAFGVTKERP